MRSTDIEGCSASPPAHRKCGLPQGPPSIQSFPLQGERRRPNPILSTAVGVKRTVRRDRGESSFFFHW